MTLKVRILQFGGSNNFDQKCSKTFSNHFCDQWSISFSLKSFYQIPLTWSKYYYGTQYHVDKRTKKYSFGKKWSLLHSKVLDQRLFLFYVRAKEYS